MLIIIDIFKTLSDLHSSSNRATKCRDVKQKRSLADRALSAAEEEVGTQQYKSQKKKAEKTKVPGAPTSYDVMKVSSYIGLC